MINQVCLFVHPRFPQTDTNPSAILRNEIDTGSLQGAADYFSRRPAGLTRASLKLTNRYDPYARSVREFLLVPVQEATRGAALAWCNHHSQTNSTVTLKIA